MKQISLVMIMAACALNMRAQNSVPLSVYASGGGTGTWGANTLNWTLGECFTITGTAGNGNTACFGFNQGYALTVGLVETPYTNNLKVYPNPTAEILLIELDQQTLVKSAGVFNTAGQLLATVVLQPGTNAYNCTHLPAGTYILKLFDEGTTNTSSILFQKIKNN